MFQLRKKTIAVTTAAFVIAGGGAAFAYWTTSGSGSGAATNSSTAATVALTATFADGLAPGVTEDVTFWATNPDATDLQVPTIHSAVATDKPGCDPLWFDVPDFTVDAVVAGKTTSPVSLGKGSITLKNVNTPQDACKGAKVTLTLSTVPTPPPGA